MASSRPTRSEPPVASDAPAGRRAPLGRSFAVSAAGSVGMLVCNMFTGVLSARLLAPGARGEVGAVVAWIFVGTYLSGLGVREGLTYLESRDHTRAPAALTAAVTSAVVLGLLGVLVAELVIPFGFSEQSAQTVRWARIFMLVMLPHLVLLASLALLGARQRFAAGSLLQVAQPFVYAVVLGVLWATDAARVGTVLAAYASSFVVTALIGVTLLARESGFSRPGRQLIRDASSYGVRAYGNTLGQLTNARLDQMVLPAFLVPEKIGLYVVAVSGAMMIVALFGSFRAVLFPAAARAGADEGVRVTRRMMRLVALLSVGTAVPFAILAPFVVRLLYGSAFDGSVTPLRLLLPGVCMFVVSGVVTGGLNALGRPGVASSAQFVGVVVTVVGLASLLGPLGIEGAAITSSLSYTTVCVILVVRFNRVTGSRLADSFSVRELGADLRWTRNRLAGLRAGQA